MVPLPKLAQAPEWAGLCELLLGAERLSMRCSAWQAGLACDKRLARRLAAQSRHEAAHVALFETVVGGAPARHAAALKRPLAALAAYEQRLVSALRRGDLPASLLGLQIVLEGIGIELFRRFDAAPALRPLRRMLLLQEQGHHELGLHLLTASPGSGAAVELSREALTFVQCGREVLDASASLLHQAGVRAADLDPGRSLPPWLACA